MKNLIYLLLCTLFFCSTCTKEVIMVEEVERDLIWEPLSDFQYYYKRFFQARHTPKGLILQGEKTQAKLTTLDDIDWCILPKIDHYRSPIGERFFIQAQGENSISLAIPELTCISNGVETIQFQDIDSSFNLLSNLGSHKSMFLISGNNLMMPYRNNENQLMIALLQFTFPNLGLANPDLVNIQTIPFTDAQTASYIFNHWPVEDGFLITNWSQLSTEAYGTYHLSFGGELQKVLDHPITRSFVDQGVLYGIYREKLLTSDDQGLTWNTKFTFTTNDLEYFFYHVADGQIFALRFDDIFKVIISDEAVELVELNTKDLETHLLTDIVRLDSVALVTTLSGVFTRNWDEFILDEI